MTIRDNRDYIRALLYSYYTTITGWGVLLRYIFGASEKRAPPSFLRPCPSFSPPPFPGSTAVPDPGGRL